MIDLHCHSNFSDGILTPKELVQEAIASEVKILALTDHDTMAGVKGLREASLNTSLTIINGVEFSVNWKKCDIHVLGLNVDHESEALQNLIKQQNERRVNRAFQIADKINFSCKIESVYEKACSIAGHERIGRPHFAQVILNEGLVPDLQTAFKRYLGRGRLAYIPTVWTNLSEVIRVINQAHGHAILAHPLKYSLTQMKLNDLLKEFKEAGGHGIEVVSGDTTLADMNMLASYSNRYHFLASTGSDFHGKGLSRISIGRQPQLPLNCQPIWHQWNL